MTSYPIKQSEFFNKDDSLCLKGIMCALILCHHLYQFTAFFFGTPLGFLLNLFGEWAVSVFLFISGYGLVTSYITKGNSYLNGFITRRFLPLYLKYLFFVLIYFIYDYSHISSYKLILTSLTWGATIVSFGWFFPLIFAIYLGFYLVFKIFNSPRSRIIAFCIFLVAYICTAFYFAQNYLAIIPFAFGCLTAYKKENAEKIVSKHPMILLAFSFVMFSAYYILYVLVKWSGRISMGNALYSTFEVLSYLGIIIFAVTFTEICRKARVPFVNNRITKWLGKYSLEIYAIQGLVLRYFIFCEPVKDNLYIYTVISIFIILISAYLINKIFTAVTLLITKKHRA